MADQHVRDDQQRRVREGEQGRERRVEPLEREKERAGLRAEHRYAEHDARRDFAAPRARASLPEHEHPQERGSRDIAQGEERGGVRSVRERELRQHRHRAEAHGGDHAEGEAGASVGAPGARESAHVSAASGRAGPRARVLELRG